MKILKEALSIAESIELTDFMYDYIEVSYFDTTQTNRERFMTFLETCTMSDFFYDLQEIYDDDGSYEGKGVRLAKHTYVLNDDTMKAFNEAFETARERFLQNKQVCRT